MSTVQSVHDAAALSDDAVVQSTRPALTSEGDLRRMTEDVISKLRLSPDLSVIELGCGTGLLGIPIAGRVQRYVGVDFAAEALAVLMSHAAGLPIETLHSDFLSIRPADVGRFDRVLVYASFHYAGSRDEAEQVLDLIVDLLKPGGVALVGNLPLPGNELPHSTAQRIGGLGWRLARKAGKRRRHQDPPSIAGLVELRRPWIEQRLRQHPQVSWDWVAPRIGTPMFAHRADLLIRAGL